MSYLIDTNVLSELVRPRPDRRVVEWMDGIPGSRLHISVLTLGELRQGVERLRDGRRRERLRLWLEEDLPGWFDGRVLAVDAAVADRWGRLLAVAGRPVPAVDSLLAATALVYGLRLVTRNVKDFDYAGLDVIDPWHI